MTEEGNRHIREERSSVSTRRKTAVADARVRARTVRFAEQNRLTLRAAKEIEITRRRTAELRLEFNVALVRLARVGAFGAAVSRSRDRFLKKIAPLLNDQSTRNQVRDEADRYFNFIKTLLAKHLDRVVKRTK